MSFVQCSFGCSRRAQASTSADNSFLQCLRLFFLYSVSFLVLFRSYRFFPSHCFVLLKKKKKQLTFAGTALVGNALALAARSQLTLLAQLGLAVAVNRSINEEERRRNKIKERKKERKTTYRAASASSCSRCAASSFHAVASSSARRSPMSSPSCFSSCTSGSEPAGVVPRALGLLCTLASCRICRRSRCSRAALTEK